MTELIHHFGIDWRLLAAQAANFLILLFLLKKFAWKPILAMLQARKREIEKGLEFTQKAEERLTRVEEERAARLSEADREALEIVERAEGIAKKREETILAEADIKTEALVEHAKRVIAEEKIKMRQELSSETRELIRLGLGRVMGKMPEEHQERLIREALLELRKASR